MQRLGMQMRLLGMQVTMQLLHSMKQTTKSKWKGEISEKEFV